MYRILTTTIAAFLLMALTMYGIAEEKPAPDEKIDVSAVAKGNNEFAFDLYRQLAKEAKPEENIFFSPYSISAALAMTYAGAKGETAEQMAQVLRFERDQDKFHPAFAQLSRQIRTPGKEFKGEINIANAIWSPLTPRESFQQVMNRHYEAGLRKISFFPDSEAARQTINGWVAEETKQKIQELLPQGALDSRTTMVLTNAIYFQADWLMPFDEKQTKEEKFYRTPEEVVTVPMMHRTKTRLRYGKTEDVEIVELPYAGKQFSMIILLPASHEKLAAVEQGLAQWDDWMAKLRPRKVVLAMPKVNLAQKFQLVKALEAMGLTVPFSPSADFSGIGSGVGHIGAVYHDATLEMDESGTTAAAATAVVMLGSASRPVEVTINRPFLVALRDTEQGEILFLGRVFSPAVK